MPLESGIAFPQDWPRIRGRYEAWWAGEPLDTPLLRITAPKGPFSSELPPLDPAALWEWFANPDRVLPRLERAAQAVYLAGDAFPWVDPVSLGLAAIQVAYLGAPYHIDPQTLTAWAEPVISNWSSRPRFMVDPQEPWWQATQSLLDAGAQRGAGHYAIAIPDLQGGGEILALLRGSERLALDLYDCPEEIAPALEEINVAWLEYYQDCTSIVHRWQDGYVDWLGIWSEKPAVTVECDFSVMISPEMFNRFFLPALAQQVEWIGRTVFHLDGPGAIRHLDALLSLPGLRAIQWIPTPDRPRMTGWIPLRQRIQAGGKGVVVACDPDEVLPLLDALDPSNLILSTSCASPAQADALAGEVKRRCGAASA